MVSLRLVRAVLIVNGTVNLLSGLGLLLAPRWFFEQIGDFPPFNRHYAGDVGAFIAALGAGLLLAAREPRRHLTLIGVAALGNLLHVLNHLYDDVFVERGGTLDWLTNTAPLLGLALLLLWAWRKAAAVPPGGESVR